jgi:dual specificity MAP kinase phosphatase
MIDFSKITEDLFIGTTPFSEDYPTLRELGIKLVINMRFGQKPFPDPTSAPMDVLWLKTFDNPILLIPMRTLLTGVHAALDTIAKGGKVYSHCAKGRHRSVAMGASILIAQGHSAQQAMDLIKRQRPISDPGLFYIRSRIFRFARLWQEFRHPVSLNP